MKISTSKYKTADPKGRVTFTHPWQDRIHPVLSGRIAYLASVKGKSVACNSGFRSDEEQISAQKAALAAHPDYYQVADGGVYNKKGQRMAAPVGQSNHGYGLAVDSDGTWLEEMTSAALLPYGLYKPMSYESWHIEPVETKGMSWDTKKTEFYEYMGGGYYPMDVKSFQMIVGLKPDGIAGTQTKAKFQEVLECIGPVLLDADGNKVNVAGSLTDIKTIAFAGTTYGPIRPIAEALGKKVTWDGKTKVITIK
jgi:hypothetical protein